MSIRNHRPLLLAAALLAVPGAALAQGTDAGAAAVTDQAGRTSVGMEEAIEAARNEFDGGVLEAEIETEDGRLVYEIDLVSDGEVREASVDAQTGEVIAIEEQQLKTTWQRWFDSDRLQAAQAAGDALTDALPEAEETTGGFVTEASLEEEDGRLFYEIEVETPEGEQEATIDAASGAVTLGEFDD